MTLLPASLLDAMVYGALAISALAPVILLWLLWRDAKAGKLW